MGRTLQIGVQRIWHELLDDLPAFCRLVATTQVWRAAVQIRNARVRTSDPLHALVHRCYTLAANE